MTDDTAFHRDFHENHRLLDLLPDGRYFDGTYEWRKDDDDWTPIMAPSGMPFLPRYSELKRVVITYEPLTPVPAEPIPAPPVRTYTLTHPTHGTILNVIEAVDVARETGAVLPLSITGMGSWTDSAYLLAMGWTITADDTGAIWDDGTQALNR
jgi:hypothetical protein